MRTILLTALLGLVAAVTVPPAQAAAEIGALDCNNYYWDQDRDGHHETWNTCSTPECGCYCPVAGGILTVEAAGQEKSVLVFASCQSGYGQATEASPDPSRVGIRFTPIAYGGGLGPIIVLD